MQEMRTPVERIQLSGKRISIAVKTGSPETRITKKSGELIYLDVAASPEKNNANLEIIKFLSKMFGKKARIVSGATKKRKIVALE